MKISRLLCLAVLSVGAAFAQEIPAPQPQTASATAPAAAKLPAPKGETIKFTFDTSKIYPGTSRDVWVYVPTEYDAAKPACLLVDQDKLQFNVPQVLDQLIASKEMPVTIAVGVAPGVVKAVGDKALPRFNRSYEFDSVGDNYARFLLEELLPAVEKMKTGDGRAIHFSPNPDDRMICGSSSGAIAAFTVAWERPESFHRVFSAIGTFVDLRSGNNYPSLIRKFEPKPIRIFLQDGSADHNHYGGDWWMANQEMERAFTFAGYEVNHMWGKLGHVHTDADAIFPDAMRWLWKDYPAGVKAGLGSEQLQMILLPGENWKIAAETGRTDGPAVNAAGEVFFNDQQAGITYKIGPDGKATPYLKDVKQGGQTFGADGKFYGVSGGTTQVMSYDADNKPTLIATGIHCNDLAISHTGDIYITESGSKPADLQQVWHVKSDGTKTVVETGLKFPNGVCFSPDQSLLYVDDYRSHWVYSYQVQPDGTLTDKQRFYDLYVRDFDDDAGADGMKVDRDGRLYVATRAGVQVCDQAGRVVAIIPTPNGKISNLVFGGKDFDTLFVTAGNTLYSRKLKVKGIDPSANPLKPTPPKL